jgi:uncharacterized protein (TIGR02996 family)
MIDSLLQAILDNPLDDAPRLVYADWLEEHEEYEKGEYMRLVVKLTHAPEDHELVERVLEVSKDLPTDWRRQAGARFDLFIVAPTQALIDVLLTAIGAVIGMSRIESMRRTEGEHPVYRLRQGITREDAEHTIRLLKSNPAIRLFLPIPLQGFVRPTSTKPEPAAPSESEEL